MDRRAATVARLVGLILISWTVFTADHHPSTHGRGLVVSILLALVVAAWLWWTAQPNRVGPITPDLWVMAAAGGLLCAASPHSAASAFAFVAVVAAGIREDLRRA